MADTFCVKHGDKMAVGYCSKCNKPYCADCLDMETGKPVCLDCLKAKAAAAPAPSAPPNPMAGSPLNFKGKGLDDDPLGLFGAGGPKIEAPKLNTPATSPPIPAPIKPPTPSPMPMPSSPVPLSLKAPSPLPGLDQMGAPPAPAKPPLPLSLDQLGMAPISADQVTIAPPKSPLDLDSMSAKPSFPQASYPVPPSAGSASSLPFPADIPIAPVSKQKQAFSLVKIWAKFLVRRAYEMFDPLAKKLKIPTYLVIGLIAAVIVGAVIGVGAIVNQPSVPMVDTIQPLHMIQVNSSQVSEMDITAYTDVTNQIQTMGFQPVLQMTIPQLPSPNFFDVSMKEDANTYSEIIKMPGQLTPHLSFVTVFTNGTWFSTNGWPGTNQTLDSLVSEFYPNDTPDQLYVQHMQTLEKLKQEREWEPQGMSENRYLAALSDRIRTFLDKKGVAAYQADFALWH